jgi:thioredoxin-related protein
MPATAAVESSANEDELAFDEAFDSGFDDAPRQREITYPEWFKHSFLDLREDLKEALRNGKKGIALYFGQKNCAYCKALMEVNFGKPDLARYVRDNFDVIPLDIWGSRTLTMMDGSRISEKELALQLKTNFTPSLVFFDASGNIIFKMRGYYKPYRFQAMMDYLVEGFYKNESFRDYLERADPPPRFDEEDLNELPEALTGPVILDRRAAVGQKPLAVLFEQRKCHACDQLHSDPLHNALTKKMLDQFEVRQLDAWSDTPIITPRGERITAVQLAKKLNIYYLPTIVFFDESGNEIDRIDSVVKLYRLRNMLNFILSDGYHRFRSFQHWRRYTPIN